jgi:hypothetical protein
MNGREGSQDGQDGQDTVASQWLRAELQMYSDSNVELNDTRSKQTSSPMAVFGWYMLVLLLVVVFNTTKLTYVFGSKVLGPIWNEGMENVGIIGIIGITGIT